MSCREAAVPQVPHGLVGVPRHHAATPDGAEGGSQVGGRGRLDRPAFEVADNDRHGPSERLLDDGAPFSPHLVLSASAGRGRDRESAVWGRGGGGGGGRGSDARAVYIGA